MLLRGNREASLRENGVASKVSRTQPEIAREIGAVYVDRARVSITQGMRQAPALGMEAVHIRRELREGELYKMCIVCC